MYDGDIVLDSSNIYWRINDGRVYSPTQGEFVVDAPEEYIDPLYSSKVDLEHLVLADIAYLRQQLAAGIKLGMPWILADELKNKLDKQEEIQAEYTPQLTAIQTAYTSAQLAGQDTTALAEMYTTTRNEMRDKINAIPND